MTSEQGKKNSGRRHFTPHTSTPTRTLRLRIPLIVAGTVLFTLVTLLLLSRDRSPESLPPADPVTQNLAEQQAAEPALFSSAEPVDKVSVAEESHVDEVVSVVRHLPYVTDVFVQPKSFYRGIDLTVNAEVIDKGDDLTGIKYRWFVNDQHVVVIDDAVLPGDEFYRGDRLSLEVIAYDAEGDGPIFRTADVVVPNGPPRITSRPPEFSNVDQYEYLVQAVDPDEDKITFSLELAPADMSIDPDSGLLNWPIKVENVGVYTFLVVASDPEGLKSSQEYSLNFSLTPKH